MWIIFALLTSIISAIYDICNQNSKLKAEIFIIYRGFFVALIATPLALMYFHIFPWQFYAIAIFQGICVSYSDYRYFKAYQKYGAENVKAVTPLDVFIIFFLWLILKPSIIDTYLQTILRSCIIVISLILISFAVSKYRNQKIGRNCLKEIFPILFLSAMVSIGNKFIMEYNDGYLLPLTFHRIVITGWIIGTINVLFRAKNLTSYKELIQPTNLFQAWFLVLMVLRMILLNFSMYYTVNPAYVSAILLLSVVWIITFNKIKRLFGKRIPYQPIAMKWIFLLLFGTIMLVLATQQ